MSDFNAKAYTITVKRVLSDGETVFRASVAELPDVDAYAESQEEAYALVVDAIEALHKVHVDENRAFPAPFEDETEFSGRVTLRMGKTLHHKAAIYAEREGLSLNQFLVATIAERIGLASVGSVQVFPGAFMATQEAKYGRPAREVRLTTPASTSVALGAMMVAQASRPSKKRTRT